MIWFIQIHFTSTLFRTQSRTFNPLAVGWSLLTVCFLYCFPRNKVWVKQYPAACGEWGQGILQHFRSIYKLSLSINYWTYMNLLNNQTLIDWLIDPVWFLMRNWIICRQCGARNKLFLHWCFRPMQCQDANHNVASHCSNMCSIAVSWRIFASFIEPVLWVFTSASQTSTLFMYLRVSAMDET